MAPYAVPVGAGESGEDILNPPEGLVVEIKARETVSLVSALGQALRSNADAIPVVIWRHNGQGEASMDDWTVTMRLADFENLWRDSDREKRNRSTSS